jgi:hypothetical protein
MDKELKKEAFEYAYNKTQKLHSSSERDFVYEIYLEIAEPREKRIEELEAQVEKMKAELHHRLVSPSHDDSDCLDKIVGLDRLWQFGKEF